MRSIYRKNAKGIFVITCLYLLQGMVLGLFGCFTLVLKDTNQFDYSQFAILSLAIYPFSFKLLWAPVIDAVWIDKVGQRKTWIVAAQCILGLFLLALSFLLPSLIEAASITPIAALLFGCIFLITVQDIAVDGWCLTLLTEDCVGAAANCQVVGQGLGALSYNLYFSVMVPYFELPFETYLKIIGLTYIVASLVVLILITERNDPELQNSCLNVKDSYFKLCKLLTLRALQIWIIICLTCKMSFAPHGEVLTLKLKDACVDNSIFSKVSLYLKPVGLLITIFLTKWTVKNPIGTFLITIPFYTLTCGLSCLIIKYAEDMVESSTIMWALIVYEILNRIAHSCVYLSASAFHYQIADPDIGGIYMTLLNSVFNLGGTWVETVSLKIIGKLDDDVEKRPVDYCDQYKPDFNGTSTDWEPATNWDSYYYLAIGAAIIGVVWYVIFFKIIKACGQRPKSDWRFKEKGPEFSLYDDEKEFSIAMR